MIERAASFLVRNGPVTGEDRWEEDAGYSPFTLAVEIAALLAAADMLDSSGKADAARYLRETADCWNEQVERWTYVTDTEICVRHDVKGYYVRIAPPDLADAASPKDGFVPIKNRPPDETDQPPQAIVSPDALALVRFGLRAADDPRIVDTVKVIDAQLRCDLPQGPVWYRYNGDGYGEHADGEPFDGTGQGRPWPLLAGERAHYELAAGHIDKAESLLTTLEAIGRRRRPAAGAGLGRRGHAGARIAARRPDGQRHAAGLGSFGAYQAAAFAARRQGLRHAAARREALRRGQDRLAHQVMALQQQDTLHAVRKDLARGVAGGRRRALEH